MAKYNLFDAASLVMVPTGTKDGKLYSTKPVDGSGDFTFSRGTTATRVNSDGLIEKGRENVLLQSNQFDTTWASVFTANVVGGQAGYDGSNDAWTLETQSGQASRRTQSTSGLGSVNSFSVYAKANTLDWIRLQISTATGNYVADFDLTNGVSGYTFGSPLPSIQSIGSGWYRVTISGFAPPTEVRIYAASGDNDLLGAGTIYIQDAQLEQGLVATDYIETTTSPVTVGITEDLPRIDYTGGCGSLLLEPSRVNLVTNSEYFSTATWFSSGAPAMTNNVTTSPEGVQNAAQLEFGGTSTLRYASELTFTNGYAYSIFVKKNNARYVTIAALFFTSSKTIGFDLDTGTCQEGGVIEPFGNDWYRLSVSESVAGDADKSGYFYLYSPNTLGGTTSGAGNLLYVYGAQIEEGSYPTSYIPTYGSASTRGEDDCWLLNSGLMPTDYPVTLFVEAPIQTGKDEDFISFGRSDVSDSYKAIQFQDTSNKVQVQNRVGASNTILESSSTYTTGTLKIAYKLTATEVKVFVNGVEEVSSTSVQAFDSVDDLLLGQLRIISDTNRRSTLKQALVFPIALTDAECIALTTI